MSLIDPRSVQQFLAINGAYHDKIDGIFGQRSNGAARHWCSISGAVPLYRPEWPDSRVRIAVEQAMMKGIGAYALAIDGIAGAGTQVALEKWQDHLAFHSDIPVPGQPTVWPRQADVVKFYGDVGANQTMLESPYPLFLDWALSQSVKRFSIHEKVHDAALRVMGRVLSHYGQEEIHRLGLDQFGGCLNVRKMRNGTTWSMHAWGIAIDWDADRNPLRATSRTALMATAPYAPFLDLWEEEGFISLGRARNYDWMHVQAAQL